MTLFHVKHLQVRQPKRGLPDHSVRRDENDYLHSKANMVSFKWLLVGFNGDIYVQSSKINVFKN